MVITSFRVPSGAGLPPVTRSPHGPANSRCLPETESGRKILQSLVMGGCVDGNRSVGSRTSFEREWCGSAEEKGGPTRQTLLQARNVTL